MQVKGKNAFLKGTISISISVIITKILGVLFKVPLSYVLGDNGMGYFNSAYAIYGFFYILCTAGVPKSMMLVLSEQRMARGGAQGDACVLKYSLRLFGKIGLISTLFNIICAPMLARMIGNPGAMLSLLAVAPSIFFVSLSGVLRGYLNSNENLTVIAVSQLTEATLKLGIGLAFSYIGVRIGATVSVIAALAIMGITLGSIGSFAYMYIDAFYCKKKDNMEQRCNFECALIRKRLIKNAFPIALGTSLLNISATLDLVIIIRQLVKNGATELYANSIYGNYTTLAIPMFNLVIAVLAPIATSYMPKLSEHSLRGERDRFLYTLNQLLYVTLIISIPAALSFYFYSFDLLDILFSSQSSAVGAELLACLSLGLCFLSLLTVVNTALESQGRIKATVLSLLLGCIVKLVSSYFLIGKSTFGILGAPIGTVLSYGLSLSVSLIFLEITGYRTRVVVKMLLLLSIGYVSFALPYRFIYATAQMGGAFLSMALSIAVSILMYLVGIGVYFLALRTKCQNAQKTSFRIS